ncbi:hypothetical protein SLEP1_g14262 [Rubroshorea leprosula]|uniref:Uncharacterized protein n=1 Tax=Rubroshorea leprosula TaxID=152421 RepID=A0AAV5IPG3_9ROSI|nr:hypothetical protein SLEP1_g14262 [Rubroshorea leprosula]
MKKKRDQKKEMEVMTTNWNRGDWQMEKKRIRSLPFYFSPTFNPSSFAFSMDGELSKEASSALNSFNFPTILS